MAGGVLHIAPPEFIYFPNLIPLGWSCSVLWGPPNPLLLGNKFLLGYISEKDTGCWPIPLGKCAVCIFCPSISGIGCRVFLCDMPRRKRLAVEGEGSSDWLELWLQPLPSLLCKLINPVAVWMVSCLVSSLCTPAFPSPGRSIWDTDFTHGNNKPTLAFTFSVVVIVPSW